MLNFAPTDEQEEVRRLAHDVATEQLRTQGRGAEKQGDISPALMQILAQTGLTTPFPEKLGGSGPLDAVTYTLIAEELGFGDGGLAMNVLGSMMGPLAVALIGDQDQQERYIPAFCDDRTGYEQRGSFAFAERTGGYALADVSATIHEERDYFVLNGTKRDVIHGGTANVRVVLARREGTEGIDGLCAVLVTPDMEGVQVSNDAQKLGLIAAPSASYTFENVRVPMANVLGLPDNSNVVRAATLYQILRAGVAIGMARAGLEYAMDYAKERIAFGRPIVSYQGIAFMISEMAMKLDAARLLLWRAAVDWDRGVELVELARNAEAAQQQAVKIAKAATIDAVQILGGAGFIQDHPVEMWMRNAAAME
jgi:alkylation response protein AidB-like acyl-CoA dehydrogenase